MTGQDNQALDQRQLAALEAAFHRGTTEASGALAKWTGKPSVIRLDSLEQLALEEATDLLAGAGELMCFCSAEINGLLTGEMILAFDDESGLALCDALLDQPQGSEVEWTEMAMSAALETANILYCAYLNSLSRSLSGSGGSVALLPTPPKFSREYTESLLEFVMMGQAVVRDQVILARARFEIDATPVNWTLLFVPDAESLARLVGLLPGEDAAQ